MRSDKMGATPEPNPAETLVLDEDELAELDNSSLTSIMRDASRLQDMLENGIRPTSEPGHSETDADKSDD